MHTAKRLSYTTKFLEVKPGVGVIIVKPPSVMGSKALTKLQSQRESSETSAIHNSTYKGRKTQEAVQRVTYTCKASCGAIVLETIDREALGRGRHGIDQILAMTKGQPSYSTSLSFADEENGS